MTKSNILKTRIDALLNVLSEDVLVVNQSGEIIFVSSTCSALPWGDHEALNGRPIDDIFSGAIALEFQGLINQALNQNKVISQEVYLDPDELPFFKNNGMSVPCWIEIRMAPSAGDEPSVVCRIEDISDRRKEVPSVTPTQRDLLTGMYNRRALMPVLAQSIAQALRYDWVCSLVIIDIDDFSTLNDVNGWDAGDQVLKRLAESLSRLKRTADFLARVDEDCFAILLPETNQEQGELAAQRIQNMVADLSGTDINFTVSIGVSTLSGEGDSADEMYSRADEGLAMAKARGGNSIVGMD